MHACVASWIFIYIPLSFFVLFQQVPPVPCRYRPLTGNMTDHIKSLHTLVPLLSNLISSEAQLITGNLTEVILPIVKPLVVSTGLHSIDTYLSFVNYWSYVIITIYHRMHHLGKGFMSALSTVQHHWLQFPHSANKKGQSVSWTDWELPTTFSSMNLRTRTLSYRMTLAPHPQAHHEWNHAG